MTISDKEIKEDFQRFIRHEAMRANCTQDVILKILAKENFGVFIDYCQYVKKNLKDGQVGNS